jgi:NAD(P)-dependent dehydrogenase (short-subunit alcohol dehydrogenase family)
LDDEGAIMTTQKTITLITGANKGLGKETARQLLAQGHHVIVTARNEANAKAAAAELGHGAEALVLDVDNNATIQHAVKTVAEKHGRLDVLINNAGIAEDFGTPVTQVTAQAWDKTFATNVTGALVTTQAFLPLLKKGHEPRVVNLSSILGSIGLSSDSSSPIAAGVGTGAAYGASKAALNMLTVHLAQALRADGIKVNAVHPGWVQTDMGGKNAPMVLVDGVKSTVTMATLPKDGPTGTFTHMSKSMPW